jgi:hypothetical protein
MKTRNFHGRVWIASAVGHGILSSGAREQK